MNEIFTKAVWECRGEDNCEAGIDVNVAFIPTGGTSYQLYVPSSGCKYACTMCNYGFNHPVREKEILKEVEEICDNLPDDIETLILESSGSFLDDRELPESLQISIMRIIARTNVYRIQFETRYETVTPHKLQLIKQLLHSHEIAFEFGVESLNPDVLRIYNKDIVPEKLLETIWLLEQNGMEASINIMVGAPLLSIKEQIEDSLNSISWMIENCPESTCAVLFPLNIKDYTLVKHMYNQGRYEVISHWEFIEVLSRIPNNVLDRIFISWWGNRINEFHGRKAIIFPKACPNCESKIMNFYNDFVNHTDLFSKQLAVENISRELCDCRSEYERKKESQKGEFPCNVAIVTSDGNLKRFNTFSIELRFELEKLKLESEFFSKAPFSENPHFPSFPK